MPNRPDESRDINPARVAANPLLREIAEMLAYLDLHLGRYPWTQLTTVQKELLADLIDSAHVLDEEYDYTPGNEPWFVTRWWHDDWVQPDPQDSDQREPDPFVDRRTETPAFARPNSAAYDIARHVTMGESPSPRLLEEQIAVYEWALTQVQALTRTDGRTGRWSAYPSVAAAREFLAEYRRRNA